MTGEAGIGKPTLIEGYLPLLEALERLRSKRPHTEVRTQVIDVMRQTAPLWLAQIPVLPDDAQLATLKPGIAGATRGRRLREMALTLVQLSQQ